MSRSSRRPHTVCFESFERRVLMAAVNDAIATAIARVSDLSQYSAAQLRDARLWAVTIDNPANVGRLRHVLGAEALKPTALIDDVYFASFPTRRTGQSIATAMRAHNPGNAAWPLIAEELTPRLIPNDPQFAGQWHLRNTGQGGGLAGADANVVTAWDEYLGDGVVIGVVDDGVSPAHPDLAPNYRADLSWDFVANDPDPSGGSHGASVAGVAGAKGNNAIGVSGSAPNAQHAGIKLLGATGNDQTVANALTHRKNDIDLYNNSWGPSDGGTTLGGGGPLSLAAMADAAATGRDGLGNIWVWACGNGGNGDNVNYDSYANSRYTVSVAAITNTGVRSSYSERGAPNLVAAYSNGGTLGITTTASGTGYTTGFGGTSSASPLAAGVIALMLDANPNLTWRDVQHVLVNSAEKIDPTNSDWAVNGAGHDVNHFYGYGGIDAQAAVDLAETWTNVLPEVTATTGTINVNQPIPNNSTTGITHTVDVTDAIKLETVEVVFNASHLSRGELQIILTSPSGTQSVLATERADTGDNYNWLFTTKRLFDEDARGTWTIKVIDDSGTTAGTFNNYKINLYGTQLVTTPSVYGTVYDDDNANGTRDGGEAGLPNVQVYIDADNDGQFDAGEPTSNTTATGSYGISDLTLGGHVVRAVAPAGLRLSQPGAGSYSVNLTAGQNFSSNNNFGFVNPRVAGTVFNDANDNGARDGGEGGLSGVTVFIDENNNGTPDAGEPSAVTPAAGTYDFGGLDDGTYVIRAVTPSGRRLTLPAGNGSHSATISNATPAVLGQNFGYTDRARVQGVVYLDANANGVRDAGENGLDGARLYQDLNDNGTYDNVTQTDNSTNVPIAFPVGTATANSTLTIGGGASIITKLTVRLNITHTWNEDLDVFLVSPSGTRVELFTDVGGSSDNFTNTVFDDAAATSITAGTGPFAGTFRPEGLLSAFNGQDTNGTWRLEITDDFPSADGGTLNSWSLTINSTEPSVLSSATGAYTFAALPPGSFRLRQVPIAGHSLTQPSSGLYSYNLVSAQLVTDANFGNSTAVPPIVNNATFAFDGPGSTLPNAPHRLSYAFSQPVGNSIDASDLQLVNTTTSTTVPAANVAVSYNAATNTATFTFPGYPTGVLPDGNYTATLLAAGVVVDGTGTPMAADFTSNFFVLGGDANHDGTINLDDFNALAANFGQSPRVFSQGDFNYDGTVNLDDFNILASRFGTVTGTPSSGAASSPIGTRAAGELDDEAGTLDELLG